MSAALLMPRDPVHGCVCFGQTSQRLLDFLSRGISALDVPDHLLPQPREPFRAIYIAVSRSFKVEGREPHGRRFRLSSSRIRESAIRSGNVLYSLVQTDKKKFDNVVSRHLEPTLLEDASRFLSGLPGVEIRKNVHWERGEIDILADYEASNSAFQLQAKAGMPPQGARMVAQVESRTLKAAKQVVRDNARQLKFKSESTGFEE
ncbi:hypothetical protein [Mesorhizobium sp.]|uniref:hypothetical protein n=1 Tax=Mesorhizobium sp. TaxID=1871066 RepID=UPI00257C8925|nr:hypothetical protein [Mesorhizobium sp.]